VARSERAKGVQRMKALHTLRFAQSVPTAAGFLRTFPSILTTPKPRAGLVEGEIRERGCRFLPNYVREPKAFDVVQEIAQHDGVGNGVQDMIA
jgi:hypothetical protein